MTNVPSIKHSGGIFEIFVPGVFLFLNCLAAFFEAMPDEIWNAFSQMSPTAFVTVAVLLFTCFGFLLGMVLRLLKNKMPDDWSVWLYCKIRRKEKPVWASEYFPFFNHVELKVKNCLAEDAYQFYLQVWQPRAKKEGNKRFFNFCKHLLDQKDSQIMIEINATEAQLRFLSGMFYSLLASTIILLLVALVSGIWEFHRYLVVFPIALYIFCFIVITFNYRIYRLKEVEILFDATYQNKDLFLPQTAIL